MASNRHVPIITGIVAMAGGTALALTGFDWWKYLVGGFLLWFGWASFKTGISATDQEIEELTDLDTPVSEETSRRFKDRL